jgi:hypothetical protein
MLANSVRAEAPGSTGVPDSVVTFSGSFLFAAIELKFSYKRIKTLI